MASSGEDWGPAGGAARCKRSRTMSDFEHPRPRDSNSIPATRGSSNRTVRVLMGIVYYGAAMHARRSRILSSECPLGVQAIYFFKWRVLSCVCSPADPALDRTISSSALKMWNSISCSAAFESRCSISSINRRCSSMARSGRPMMRIVVAVSISLWCRSWPIMAKRYEFLARQRGLPRRRRNVYDQDSRLSESSPGSAGH